ncbi:peptidoglycan binding domain-containing protein [Streptomyces sp. NBC_01214]|uniref:peptidoglycan binding domain-containing protein n=1 Tax=Streptomyces sp. NBC_01214 TaxID=2903777 RepID=UPI0022586212|nr:peptidoglycan binding domain-containing protein [Streptomyces sp. NBC_01214]MCX4803649.1 peptidoglycan binding domain-containing protein [Streptomyces sp. NBC_01214]
MRRASPTGTGTPAEPGRRWTATGIAGAAAGAAAVGFGGPYAAGLLLTGEEVAAGTKVRGVAMGGMSRDEARQTLDRALGPVAAAPVALRIGERTERADPAALGLSLDSAATADRAARTGSDPLTVIGRLFASGDPDLAPVVRLDEKAARAALDGTGKKTGVRAREGSVTFAQGKAWAVAPATGIAVDVDGSLDALRTGYPRTSDPGGGTEPLALPVGRTEPKVGRPETDRALKEFAEPALSAPVTLAVAGRKMSLSPAVPSKHLSLKVDGRGRLAPVRTGGGPKCEPQSPLEGFDVAVDRVFVRGGKEVGRETMKTRHTPRDRVTCGA